jgi:putative membrane protein
MIKTPALIAVIAVVVITFLGSNAVTQTNQPAPSPNESALTQNQPSQRPSSSQLSVLDNEFVTDASQGGIAEVKIGQLALQQSTNPKVEQFAQQMIQQHTQANEKLMRLAIQKGITPPTTIGSKYEAVMTQLMQFSKASFDEIYMNEMGINRHLEAAAVFQRQAVLGQDQDLKAFATKTLPTVHRHFEMAATTMGYRLAQ